MNLTLTSIMSFARWALTLFGGYVVQQGYANADQVSQLTGGALVLVTILWSLWQKYLAAEKVKDAHSAGLAGLPPPK